MSTEQFWTSQDGQILTVKIKDEQTLTLTLAFWPRNPAEFDFMKARIGELKFTERSSLARIGIEMHVLGGLEVDGNRLALCVDAFAFDMSFPNSGYWKKLMRSGIPVGRLFHAPASEKLSSDEIWTAIKENKLKLPNTISIDSQGSVFLTPHQVSYTLNPRLQRVNFELIVSGSTGRSFLDKVQVRHDASPLAIPPRSGILTSCSMYLKEHYVVLNQGEGNFGIHTSAVLLDPVKTFGTNIMLEIYNTGDHPVVNPMVSVEIFRAPEAKDPEFNSLSRRRQRLLGAATELFRNLDEHPPRDSAEPRPKTGISVRGQSATMENISICFKGGTAEDVRKLYADSDGACGHRTMIQAVDAAPKDADTLVVDYFPDLIESIELLTRIPELKLKRIVFRKASRTHGYFLSSNAHARLDTLDAINIQVYWYDEVTKDLYLHVYKKEHGFFVREEMGRKFQEATILAFYGSAVGLDKADTDRISGLVEQLSAFIGPNLGVLTGGGGGVMRLATDQARKRFDQHTRVRLVTGIYKESAEIAHTTNKPMKEALINFSRELLSCGTYVEFASHDQIYIHKFFADVVLPLGISADQFETQFLLGVPRLKLQQALARGEYFRSWDKSNLKVAYQSQLEQLASNGSLVRLYLPFGSGEIASPYCKRRLQHNPNLILYGIKNWLHIQI